jgi:hypothetical protein
MDSRQTAINTLRYAWQMQLPGVSAPDERYLGIWVHFDNGNGLALDAIEATAAQHKKKPLINPSAFCWSLLKKLIDKRLQEMSNATN